MTELKITPDAAKKRMRVEGRVAAGEKVAVTLVGFGEMDKATTRLRVLFMNTLVAVAGGGGSAAWEANGEDLAGVLDLNTVEAEQVTRCCDANCLFILDDVSAGVRQLYATAEHEVMKWIKAPGADVPTSLDGYADILAETRAEVEAFKTEIGGRLSSYQAELDAALAEYREAMNTRAEQFEAEVRSKTAANAVAITAEEAARKAADAEIVKSLGTVSDKLDGKQDTLTADQLKAVNSGVDAGKVKKIEENAAAVSALADGLASKADLVGGKVPAAQLPSFVDDVLEFASRDAFPEAASAEAGKIYVAKDTNLVYRWGGTDYVEISPSLALGETATTAYPGDRGKTAAELASATSGRLDAYQAQFDSHLQSTSNPHSVTAAQAGALPITGGTLTGDLAVGVEHTASRKLTVAAENGANGITLQGGTGIGLGSSITVGGATGNGGALVVQGGGSGGGTVFVAGGSYDSGCIVVGNATGVDTAASIKKGDKEVATEEYVDDKVCKVDSRLTEVEACKADNATTLAGYGITDAATKSELAAKQDKLTKDSAPTVGALILMGDRVLNGVSIDATSGGAYGALAVKGADNRTSVLTPDGGPVLTQALGDARYATADALASLVPESIGKTVDGAKWSLSADLVSAKTTTAAGEASCTLTTQFGSASLSKVQDRLFSGTDSVGDVAVWWDGSVWNWGVHPDPSDPTSMQSVATDPSSDANATSLSFSDGSTATIALGAGTEVVETSHLATAEAVAATYVPVTRTINGKPLSADVTLTAADVGAVGSEADPLFSAWKDATNVLIGAGASTVAPASPFVNNSVAIGPGAKTVPFYGSDGKYKVSEAVAIGHGAEAHGDGVAIGKGAVSNGNSVVLGSESTTGLTVFAAPGSFVFRTSESGAYVSKTLQSFLDQYWKKTDWLVTVPRIEVSTAGYVLCPDYQGTDGASVCFSADGNDIDDTTSRLYPDGSNVATEKTVRSVIDTKPATVNSGRLYSFKPSASSGAIAIVPAFETGLKGTAEAFLDFSTAAPAVSFGGTGVTVLYADGSLKPSALTASGLYVVELKWFSTAASGTTRKYLIVNAYSVGA